MFWGHWCWGVGGEGLLGPHDPLPWVSTKHHGTSGSWKQTKGDVKSSFLGAADKSRMGHVFLPPPQHLRAVEGPERGRGLGLLLASWACLCCPLAGDLRSPGAGSCSRGRHGDAVAAAPDPPLPDGLCAQEPSEELEACVFRMQVGQLRLYEDDQQTKVVEIVRHPQYNESLSAQGGADIALLKLEAPVPLSELTHPVSLPSASLDVPSGKTCWVTGWGVIGRGEPLPWPLSLREAPQLAGGEGQEQRPL
nr:polyserase-2-like isoform X3 [Gorilla gorilla gorilla]